MNIPQERKPNDEGVLSESSVEGVTSAPEEKRGCAVDENVQTRGRHYMDMVIE